MANVVAGAPARRVGRTVPALLALALAAAALVVVVIRLPAAFQDFDTRASFNDHESAIGREIAASDLLGIDNEFLVKALQLVPRGQPFAYVGSDSPAIAKATYGTSPTAYRALAPYLLDLLLPSREVDPSHAKYILCYGCNTAPYDPYMTRLWVSPMGYVIGRLDH